MRSALKLTTVSMAASNRRSASVTSTSHVSSAVCISTISQSCPVFNLLKLHGSLTWIMENDKNIVFSSDLAHVDKVKQVVIPVGCLVNITTESAIEDFTKAVSGLTAHKSLATDPPNADCSRLTPLRTP